jgi:hypothetical protein
VVTSTDPIIDTPVL